MDEATIAWLYEPFFTTRGSEHVGLAQVHGIVAQYGGKIEIDSQLGQGTLVVMILPLTPFVYQR